MSDFHKQLLISFKMLQPTLDNFLVCKFRHQGGWGLAQRFGANGKKWVFRITSQPLVKFSQRTPHFIQNFMTNTFQTTFFFKFSLTWGLGPSV